VTELTIKKLENSNNKGIIEEEIEILTNILDEAIKKVSTEETIKKLKKIKQLADKSDYKQLKEIIKTLTNEEIGVVSRYFALLPL